MSDQWTTQQLSALPGFESIPTDQLAWLLEHGNCLYRDSGARFFREYEDLDGLLIVLSGRVSVRVRQDGTEREVRANTPGMITGRLPYSRATTPRGFLVADGAVELLVIPESRLRDMARECYEFTALCVHAMLDRARDFKADDKQQEKMVSLGRLSAGLAHELNNPTAAMVRATRDLDGSLNALVAASNDLGAAGLSAAARVILAGLESRARTRPEFRSPLDQSDHEERIRDWLASHHLDDGAANALARTALTGEDLDEAAGALDVAQLALVMQYLAASVTARLLAADITSAAQRVHSLVAAVKAHTHMDQPTIRETIRLQTHLADTVTLMQSKAASKDVALQLVVDADLPPVVGTVADLNQVWIQLVDNAVDAAPRSSVVSIEAKPEGDAIHVRVIDDGPGIPAADRERVFDPFFTTKDVGFGRGLGLDIVQTVVRSHRGFVTVDSRPGRTVFSVSLPAAAG